MPSYLYFKCLYIHFPNNCKLYRMPFLDPGKNCTN